MASFSFPIIISGSSKPENIISKPAIKETQLLRRRSKNALRTDYLELEFLSKCECEFPVKCKHEATIASAYDDDFYGIHSVECLDCKEKVPYHPFLSNVSCLDHLGEIFVRDGLILVFYEKEPVGKYQKLHGTFIFRHISNEVF